MLPSAEVLAHSISLDGAEAISMRVIMPRIVLAEFNKHRKLASNTSSSRAIPILKMIRHVKDNMFYPLYYGANQAGMQAKEELTGWRLYVVKKLWRLFGLAACNTALIFNKLGLHKQIANRIIESFSYITVIFTGTDITNFLMLRNHPDAQPEIKYVAEKIQEAYENSTPKLLQYGEWHLPLVTEEEKLKFDLDDQIVLSVARCASTSYTTVDGKQMDLDLAHKIVDKLSNSNPIHASPFEHQLKPDRMVVIEYRRFGEQNLKKACVWMNPNLHGCTLGYIQYRKKIKNESQCDDIPYFLIP